MLRSRSPCSRLVTLIGSANTASFKADDAAKSLEHYEVRLQKSKISRYGRMLIEQDICETVKSYMWEILDMAKYVSEDRLALFDELKHGCEGAAAPKDPAVRLSQVAEALTKTVREAIDRSSLPDLFDSAEIETIARIPEANAESDAEAAKQRAALAEVWRQYQLFETMLRMHLEVLAQVAPEIPKPDREQPGYVVGRSAEVRAELLRFIAALKRRADSLWEIMQTLPHGGRPIRPSVSQPPNMTLFARIYRAIRRVCCMVDSS